LEFLPPPGVSVAEMIARGEALTADWCFDGTFSILLEA